MQWVNLITVDINKKTYLQCSWTWLFPFPQALKLFRWPSPHLSYNLIICLLLKVYGRWFNRLFFFLSIWLSGLLMLKSRLIFNQISQTFKYARKAHKLTFKVKSTHIWKSSLLVMAKPGTIKLMNFVCWKWTHLWLFQENERWTIIPFPLV